MTSVGRCTSRDDVRDGEGLAGAGDAEQHLVPVAAAEPGDELARWPAAGRRSAGTRSGGRTAPADSNAARPARSAASAARRSRRSVRARRDRPARMIGRMRRFPPRRPAPRARARHRRLSERTTTSAPSGQTLCNGVCRDPAFVPDGSGQLRRAAGSRCGLGTCVGGVCQCDGWPRSCPGQEPALRRRAERPRELRRVRDRLHEARRMAAPSAPAAASRRRTRRLRDVLRRHAHRPAELRRGRGGVRARLPARERRLRRRHVRLPGRAARRVPRGNAHGLREHADRRGELRRVRHRVHEDERGLRGRRLRLPGVAPGHLRRPRA